MTAPALPPVESLTLLERGQFAAAIRPLFEASGPLADALYERRPFESWPALVDAAESVLRTLPEVDQVAVLNGHPRIGESANVVRETSALSYGEQGYEREADQDAEEVLRVYRDLGALNRQYEERFGFRFVVFVAGRPKAEIIPVLRSRLQNGREAELATGLRELAAIARDRLRALQGTS